MICAHLVLPAWAARLTYHWTASAARDESPGFSSDSVAAVTDPVSEADRTACARSAARGTSRKPMQDAEVEGET